MIKSKFKEYDIYISTSIMGLYCKFAIFKNNDLLKVKRIKPTVNKETLKSEIRKTISEIEGIK